MEIDGKKQKLHQDVIKYASFNYRPYWKIPPQDGRSISIVHWHGPKPIDYERYRTGLEKSKINPAFIGLLEMHCDKAARKDPCWSFNEIWRRLRDEMNVMKPGNRIPYIQNEIDFGFLVPKPPQQMKKKKKRWYWYVIEICIVVLALWFVCRYYIPISLRKKIAVYLWGGG